MLRLRTFGGASLLRDGQPLEGPAAQKRRLALLVLVACAGGRGISREKLAAYLWPESDEDRARHSLAQWLFTTRRELGGEDLFVGTTELRVNPAVLTCDAVEFDERIAAGDLEAAVQLHAGPFLDGFHVAGAGEFERWAMGEQARLARASAAALEALATARAASGDHGQAAAYWRRLAALDPCNGRVALGVMQALAGAGDIAGALAHARVHAAMLKEETGAEPQPEVTAFAERLRTDPPTFHPPANGHAANDDVANGHVANGHTTRHTRRRRMRLVTRVAMASVPLLLISLVGAFQLVPAEQRAVLFTLRSRPDVALVPNRIVVTPLENMTGDSTLKAFGYLVADRISAELSGIGEHQVVDAASVFTSQHVVERFPRIFRRDGTARAVSHEFGARLLIAGSYFREGDSLHVQVKLVDAADGRVLRSLAAPVVGVVGEKLLLAEAVVDRSVAMTASTVDSTPAGRGVSIALPRSYDAYREARTAWESYYASDTAGFYRHARRAVQLDTAYTLPLAMQVHLRAEARQWAQVDSLIAVLEQHRGKMSPLEEAVTDLYGAALRGDLEGQLRGATAVVHEAPESPETRTFAARIAINLNRPREALRFMAGVDPARGVMLAKPWYWNWHTAAFHLIGDYDRELAYARRGLKQFPRDFMAVANAGRAFATHGQLEELEDLLGRLPGASTPAAQRRWKIGIDWTRELRAHGNEPKARALLQRLHADLQRAPRDSAGWNDRFRATILGDLGRHDEARRTWAALAVAHPRVLDHVGYLALTEARLGNRAAATALDRRIAAMDEPYVMGRHLLWRARVAAALGDEEGALDLLERALAEGYPRFFDPGGGLFEEPELHADPALAPLHRNPRFGQLLAVKG